MKHSKHAQVVSIVVASPGDVQPERDAIMAVAEELNRDIAPDRNLFLRVIRWETDAYPGFHIDGPQGLVDSILRIEECDLLIGIFWKRFGTPVSDAKSGTEHEIRKAHAHWKQFGQPGLMIYFNQRTHKPKSKKEEEQWKSVKTFQSNFPAGGLWWAYNGKKDFAQLVRMHLTRWLLFSFPRAGAKGREAGRRATKRTPNSLGTARNEVPRTVLAIKLETLRSQLLSMTEDYEAINKQLNNTVSDVDRVRLRRQSGSLEQEMAAVEGEISKLEST